MAEKAGGGGGSGGGGGGAPARGAPAPGGGGGQWRGDEEFVIGGDGDQVDGEVLDDLDGTAAAPISDEDDDGPSNAAGQQQQPNEGGGAEGTMMMDDDDGEDDSLQVFDGHGEAVLAVAWSPSPNHRDLVATGGQDDGAFLWRVGEDAIEATGGTLSTTRLSGHTDSVAAVAFSSNGLLLATGGLDGTVRVWEPAAAVSGNANGDDNQPPTPLRVLDGPGGGIEWLAWHPRGEVVLAGSEDYTAWMWLARTGQCLGVLSGHSARVSAGAFSPDGRTVVTAGGRGDASLRRWNPKTGECTGVLSGHPFHPGDPPKQMDAADDDDGAGGEESGAQAADNENDEDDDDLGGGLTCLSIHADGVACLTGAEDGTLRVSNLQTMRIIASPEGHTASVEAAGFCPGGQPALAASAGLDAFLRVWDASAGFAPRAAVEHPAGVTRLCWHPQQPAIVATACLDGRVRLCDLRTGAITRVLRGHGDAVQDVCFSPDGRVVLSGSDDGTARAFSVL